MKKSNQPKPKKGSTFTSWAVYNWGIQVGGTYRTRSEAIDSIISGTYWESNLVVKIKNASREVKWRHLKQYHTIVKVKCKVL